MGNHFYTAPGGKGANQAVAAARMGAHVKMVGRVGDDVFGPPMLDDLRGYGIDTTGISVDPDHASGIAMILLDDQRQNYIVAIYGANMQCGERELAAVGRPSTAPTPSCCSLRRPTRSHSGPRVWRMRWA